jgi:hypothetical protein
VQRGDVEIQTDFTGLDKAMIEVIDLLQAA